MKQVISISPDGSISGLERKGGFDFKKLGKAGIVRASEIKWDANIQKWYVEFCKPTIDILSNKLPKARIVCLDSVLWKVVKEELYIPEKLQQFLSQDSLVYFETYEEAVNAEIETLDFLRVKGFLT